jgi:hypothetical protein
LKTWLLIDVAASFPFEEIAASFDKSYQHSVKTLKFFKLSKLLRFGRMLKYLRRWSEPTHCYYTYYYTTCYHRII